MQAEDGSWTGISVELWQRIAIDLGWDTEWVELNSVKGQIDNLASGQIDVAVGAVSMTTEREILIDFSHPFYSTGLAIATPVKAAGWRSLIRQLASPSFLSAVGILILLLLIIGVLVWLLERKSNPDQFGGSIPEGIGSGFWWSAVTMTTVGYGDKAPTSFAGRVLATIWMFVSVITISGFTAAIASSVTLDQLNTDVKKVSDLNNVRSLAVDGSTGQLFLKKKGINPSAISTPEEGLSQLLQGNAQALVHDEALLRYLLRGTEPGIEILPQTLEKQDYAFGLKPTFLHREALNRKLLSLTHNAEWQDTLNLYLGQR